MDYVNFIDNSVRVGFIDSASYGEDIINLKRGKDSLSIKLNSHAILFQGSKNPTELREYRGSYMTSALSYFITNYFSPPKTVKSSILKSTLENVTIYPDSIISGQVVFADTQGKKYITQSADTPTITLAAYRALYSSKQENLVLNFPNLIPYSSAVLSSLNKVSYTTYIDTLFSSFEPLCIKSEAIPRTGTRQFFNRVFSASDRDSFVKLDDYLTNFFYTVNSVSSSTHWNYNIQDINNAFVKLEKDSMHLSTTQESPFGRIDNSYIVKAPFTVLTDILSPLGVDYAGLKAGSPLQSSSAKALVSKLVTSGLKLEPITSKAINRKISLSEIKDYDIKKELLAFGLNDVDNIFKGLKILTYGV